MEVINNDWLRELKVGDNVFVHQGSIKFIKTVEKITPTRRMTVGTTIYNHHGYEIGGRKCLSQWTEDKELEIEKEKVFKSMCDFLGNVTWRYLGHDKVKQIYDMVKEEKDV